MSTSKNQSAINELRDQLFIGTADGARLNNVTGNLGLDRPSIGLDDDKWRAVARGIALNPKSILPAFRRILEVCVGPQKTRAGVLTTASVVGDKTLVLDSVDDFIQVGAVTLDPGLSTEETLTACFKDKRTKILTLTSAMQFAHGVVAFGENSLRSDIAISATELPLMDSSVFPTTGFPYAVILDKGTASEEIVTISANTSSTNTLTCSATTKAHNGPKSSFVSSVLAAASAIKREFVTLGANATKPFPASGLLRFDKAGANEELIAYKENQVSNNVLIMKTPLQSAHLLGESVDLVRSGAAVETISVKQSGKDWSIHQTEARKLKIYVPADVAGFRMTDASYLHDASPAPVATTLAAPTTTADTELTLTTVVGLPNEAGLLTIDGTQNVFYIFKDEATNKVTLTQAIGVAYIAGTSVDLYEQFYASTNLEEGNLRTSAGLQQDNQYPGPYVFDPTTRGPSNTTSTIATLIQPPATVVVSQTSSKTALEVDNASLWPTPPFTPFTAQIGGGTGFAEDRSITDITLKSSVAETMSTASIIGATTLVVSDSVPFPNTSDGTTPANYQIIVDAGGAAEETLFVSTHDDSTPGTLTLMSSATKAHGIGETVALVNDVITTDKLNQPHAAALTTPNVAGHTVIAYVAGLDIASATSFPTSGTVIVNFGKEMTNARSKITAKTSATLYTLADTSGFPTANFPYQVLLSDGRSVAELINVTANDTGTNELTFAAPGAVNTHAIGSYITFVAGDQEILDYTSKSGNILTFTASKLLSSRHLVGETVSLSTAESVPNADGSSYAFLLPPNPNACVESLFQLVKAAGVEIQFLTNR